MQMGRLRRSRSLLAVFAITALHSPLLAQSYTFTTFAGPSEVPGAIDGKGREARFFYPTGVAIDERGNLYVADQRNSRIRKVTPEGAVTTFAVFPTDTTFRFDPLGIAVDRSGNVYLALHDDTIRKITPAGLLTTVAGSPYVSGHRDGEGMDARFWAPVAITVSEDGTLYVCDSGNRVLRKITPAGVVSTVAPFDGPSPYALAPSGVAVDRAGNVYVANGKNCTLAKLGPAGDLNTLAGSVDHCAVIDGLGSHAGFGQPTGVAVDRNGNVYVTDSGRIRKVTPEGAVTTLAGSSGFAGSAGVWRGSADGTGASAEFSDPIGIAVDGGANVYVADSRNETIRKITPAGVVTTLAGNPPERFVDGEGNEALLYQPMAVATDSRGNVYVAEFGEAGDGFDLAGRPNGGVRRITPYGVVTKFAGDLQLGTLTIDRGENIYVVDRIRSAVCSVSPAGVISIFAKFPWSVDVQLGMGMTSDGSGNVYVTQPQENVILKFNPAGVVTTIGDSLQRIGSTDGSATAARFSFPMGLAADAGGNVYVADSGNATIRRITPDGNVSTVAGLAGVYGSADGFGSAARFRQPEALAINPEGDVYVADRGNATISRMTPAGAVTTIAGAAGSHTSVDGTGLEARFTAPISIAFDRAGTMYVADGNAVHIGRLTFAEVTDTATVDAATGAIGAKRQLGAAASNAGDWRWSVIRRPADSIAELSSATASNPSFIPDVPGLFTFRLAASGGGALRVTTIDLLSVTPRRHAAGH